MSALHPFASLLAPVFFTKTIDGTTQHQLLVDQGDIADGLCTTGQRLAETGQRGQVFAPVGRLLARPTLLNSRQRFSSGSRPLVQAA